MEASEFGRALRRWRDRIDPVDVGLSTGSRRRAAGLRREELAGLAGISADYLTRFEQGRATSPSHQVVEALARALRLNDADLSMLYELAGHSVPGPDLVSSRIVPSVQRLLDRLADTPVAVYDATWTLLAANAPYDALMGDTRALVGRERNALWRNFVGPRNRVQHSDEELAELKAGQVAELRRTAARYPKDHQLQDLIRDLRAASPLFAELWDADGPMQTTDRSRRKVVLHPEVGAIALDCDVLMFAADDIRGMVYSAEPGTPDAERLSLAIVLGLQRLVE